MDREENEEKVNLQMGHSRWARAGGFGCQKLTGTKEERVESGRARASPLAEVAKLRRRSGKATTRGAAESGELLQAQPAVPGNAHKYVWRAGDDVLE